MCPEVSRSLYALVARADDNTAINKHVLSAALNTFTNITAPNKLCVVKTTTTTTTTIKQTKTCTPLPSVVMAANSRVLRVLVCLNVRLERQCRESTAAPSHTARQPCAVTSSIKRSETSGRRAFQTVSVSHCPVLHSQADVR